MSGMQTKTVKKVLTKKIKEWLDTIEDEDVRKLAAKDCLVMGGSIASMLLGEPVNDYDIYFRTKETTIKVADYYVKQFVKNREIKVKEGVHPIIPEVREVTKKNILGEEEDRVVIYIKSAGVVAEEQDTYKYFEVEPETAAEEFVESMKEDKDSITKKYRPVFLSQNAITLSNDMQLVIRFFGDPTKVLRSYDFIHAMCYYDYHNDRLDTPSEALAAMLSKTLIYKGSLYPIASLGPRLKKFLARGWHISAGQMLKMMFQVSELDMSNIEVLEEQLQGVDVHYMTQLIDALKTVEPEKINSAYVSTIIDKIF